MHNQHNELDPSTLLSTSCTTNEDEVKRVHVAHRCEWECTDK